MGKRVFDVEERFWPEGAPFHTTVFVLTYQFRGPRISNDVKVQIRRAVGSKNVTHVTYEVAKRV